MVEIFNKTLNPDKKVVYNFTKIYGIGLSTSLEICKNFNINPRLKLKQINPNTFHSIASYIEENYTVEKNLSWQKNLNISKMKALYIYKGIRHSSKLPLNGQRTHSNAKTRKRAF